MIKNKMSQCKIVMCVERGSSENRYGKGVS